MRGKFATVYIPEHLLTKWESIKNKSKLVQEAIEEAEDSVTTE